MTQNDLKLVAKLRRRYPSASYAFLAAKAGMPKTSVWRAVQTAEQGGLGKKRGLKMSLSRRYPTATMAERGGTTIH